MLGSVLALIAVYLVAIIFLPTFRVPEQPLPKTEAASAMRAADSLAGREDVSFEVKGATIRGWLYLPQKLKRPCPVSF